MKKRDGLLKVLLGITVVAMPLVIASCSPSLNDPDYGPLTRTFAVSDIFSPSGLMGDGANPGFITVDFDQTHCKQPRPVGAQGNCYTFTYFMDPKANLFWGGAYWVFPTNSWGSRPGYAIDSTKFQQVRFSAAIEMPTPSTKGGGGDTFFNGIAGGIDGKGFYGTPCASINQHGCEHEDKVNEKDVFQIGPDIGPDFKQYHLPLNTQQVADELIGAFAWSVDFPSDSCTCSVPVTSPNECTSMMGKLNCPTPIVLHLDDIVWDTAPPPPTP